MLRGVFKKLFVALGLSIALFIGGMGAPSFPYLLALGTFIIPAGRIADMFGHKRVFLLGIVIFTLSSFFHTNGAEAFQGVGAACFIPCIQTMLMSFFEIHSVKLLGSLMGITAVGFLVGPINWISVPLGLLSLSLIYFFYPKESEPFTLKKIDIISFLFLLSFSFCLMNAIDLGSNFGFKHLHVLGWLAVAMGLLALFVVRQLNIKSPLIELSILQNHAFIMGTIFRMLTQFAFFGVLLLTENSLFLPYTIVFALLGGLFSKRFGIERLMFIGIWALALGMFLFGVHFIFWATIFSGFGVGIFLPNNSFYAINSLPKDYWGVGTAILYMGILISTYLAAIKTTLYSVMTIELFLAASILIIPMIIYKRLMPLGQDQHKE